MGVLRTRTKSQLFSLTKKKAAKYKKDTFFFKFKFFLYIFLRNNIRKHWKKNISKML